MRTVGWMVIALVPLLLLVSSADLPAGPAVIPGATTGDMEPLVVPGHLAPRGGSLCAKTALCPAWVRTAYNFSGLLGHARSNGTGQTVVIVDACGDPHLTSDVAAFDGLNHFAPIRLNITTLGAGTTCSTNGWSTETSLDVEWVHALAPGASIDLLVTTNSKDRSLFGAWSYALTNHLGAQISDSWGGNGPCSGSVASILRNASAAGVTVLASGGDAGAWGDGTSLVSQTPADCTAVLTVGGTTLNVGAGGTYTSEAAWAGSGGGYAKGKAEPSYQVNASITDPYSALGKPDVAAVADPSTGVWIYNADDGGWLTVGGTSVACPIWAAFLADVNSLRATHSLPSLGSLDPYLYSDLYGAGGSGANYSGTFHDVTTGSNGWSAGTGWDAATGLGSFNAYPLAQLLGSDPRA